MTMKTGIAIHGGAGTILKSKMTAEKESAYRIALENALLSGNEILLKNGSALDAVISAVRIMEDNPLFNAGKGSVFTNDGSHKMDASVMNGKTLNAGCVTAVSNIKNPVLLAKVIMDESDFVFLSGKGAEDFAFLKCLQFENDEYFYTELRFQQYQNALKNGKHALDHSGIEDKKFGTVGAVAIDYEGNLAAATSTGGMTNTKFGRIGDSPVIGAGTYADNNTCAVSCTGDGEYFIRTVAAYDVCAMMSYGNLSLKEACNAVIHKKLPSVGGEGGLIAIDKNCNIEMVFNSDGMYRACIKEGKNIEVKIYKG